MTSEEFWKDDPKLFSSYMKAFNNKEKRNIETQNYSNWIQGLYVYKGLQLSFTDFGYGFLAGKKNPNKDSYPDKPFDLFGKEENRKLKEKQKVKKENQRNLNFWARIKK